MARTSRTFAAVCVTVLVLSSNSHSFLSHGLESEELGNGDAKALFEEETFGGNGRTCSTCHLKDTGTLTLADVQRIIDKGDAGH